MIFHKQFIKDKVCLPVLALYRRIGDEFCQKGVIIFAAGVRRVWLRHVPEAFRKCLEFLEEHVAKAGT